MVNMSRVRFLSAYNIAMDNSNIPQRIRTFDSASKIVTSLFIHFVLGFDESSKALLLRIWVLSTHTLLPFQSGWLFVHCQTNLEDMNFFILSTEVAVLGQVLCSVGYQLVEPAPHSCWLSAVFYVFHEYLLYDCTNYDERPEKV